jgi:hypothetical protein
VASFGWILLAGAFLVLVMVANNSWPWVWAKISRGIPQPGEGNRIVPNPPESDTPGELIIPPDMIPTGPPPGSIVPVPDQPGEFVIPPQYFGGR